MRGMGREMGEVCLCNRSKGEEGNRGSWLKEGSERASKRGKKEGNVRRQEERGERENGKGLVRE